MMTHDNRWNMGNIETRHQREMPSRIILMFVISVGAIYAETSCLAELPSTSSKDTNTSIQPSPTPPWIGPKVETKLPTVVVDAITQLFKDGLPDPRGCDYREIEIAESSTWKIETHGWVLPGTQRYAVGWNGVVYPVASVGALVDLRKEFSALPTAYGIRRFRGNGNGWPMSDQGSLSVTSALPIKTAFLLRLGQVDLAEKVWNEGYAGEDDMKVKDPYADMASLWLGRWFNRAMETYLQGDYASALSICRSLSPVKKKVDATAITRGIVNLFPGKMYDDEHLWQLPILEAESERRIQEQPYTPVLKSDKPVEGPERIAALIRDFELVAAEQEMNPGETDVINDPIVQAVIKEGDPAVEPLIQCLESDNRLTRCRFTQNMWFDGPIIPVYEPAYVALVAILKITIPLPEGRDPRRLSSDDRKALAQQFRAYWSKNNALSPPERWYATLRDDAGATAWFDAVDNIVQPTNAQVYRPNQFNNYASVYNSSPASVTRQGDALRSKSNPSVSELIIERFNQVVAQTGTDENAYFDHLSNLLFALADWDGKAHFDDLRTLTAKLDAKLPHHNDGIYSTVQTTVTIYEKRVALGDLTAMDEYTAWLSGLDPDQTPPSTFLLMWQHPSDPGVQKAAEQLFAAKDSPWRLTSPKPPRFASDLISTPLIGLPIFRQSLLDALGDTTWVGGLMVNANGTYLNGEVRFCDYVALRLSDVEEFPEMKFDWPENQRNAVVERCKMLLQCYGDNYRYGPQDENQNPEPARSEHTAIAFALLDHAATPEDVTNGRAIFSLTGTARVCKMPSFPISAQRPSLPEDPVRWSGDNGITYTYDTSGKIWQAEEVQVDGKWQRYYGFAGRHQLEKVPASEIVFPRGYGDVAINESIDAQLDGPEFKTIKPNFVESYSYTTLGSPLPFTVKARNHSSFDQAVPDILILAANAGKVLPPAISFSLSYSEKIPPEVLNPTATPPQFGGMAALAAVHRFDYGSWQDVPLRKEVQVMATSQTSSTILTPTQELAVLKIDLRDYFDISRPGSYQLTALFHVAGQPETKSNQIIFSVSDTVH